MAKHAAPHSAASSCCTSGRRRRRGWPSLARAGKRFSSGAVDLDVEVAITIAPGWGRGPPKDVVNGAGLPPSPAYRRDTDIDDHRLQTDGRSNGRVPARLGP